MNSREFDDTLGELFRQALQPVAQAQPPAVVWRCITSDVQSMPLSRWARFMMRLRGFGGPYLPSLSLLTVCVEPYGHYRPSPFSGALMRQGLELRLACY